MSAPVYIIAGNRDEVGCSTLENCADCETPLVVSPGTRVDAGPHAIVLCIGCAVVRIRRDGATIIPPQARAAELDAHAERN